MTAEDFRAMCLRMLSPADAALLEYCTLDAGMSGGDREAKHTPSAFINGWRDRERTLRLNLAQYRAAKLKWDPGLSSMASFLAPSADAEAAAKAAFALDNPLDAETVLDRGRWDAIDALAGYDYFSVNTIYAYLLKLLLLERRSCFKTEEGFAEYKALYAAIMEAAPGN
jgi:hypothetical protein